MKRKLIPIVVLLLVALLSVFVFCEVQFGQYEISPKELSISEVQKKCPELILTGNDKAFAIAILELPVIQTAKAKNEEIVVTDDVVGGLVERYYPKMENWKVRVYGQSVTLEGDLDENVRIYLQFSNVVYLRKLSSHAQEEQGEQVVKTMYENMNSESYQQYRQQHIWFSYLGI